MNRKKKSKSIFLLIYSSNETTTLNGITFGYGTHGKLLPLYLFLLLLYLVYYFIIVVYDIKCNEPRSDVASVVFPQKLTIITDYSAVRLCNIIAFRVDDMIKYMPHILINCRYSWKFNVVMWYML